MAGRIHRNIVTRLHSKWCWCCVALVTASIVLTFDHSWRICIGMATVLVVGVLAAFEDATDDSFAELGFVSDR
jgi:hypothetical protein